MCSQGAEVGLPASNTILCSTGFCVPVGETAIITYSGVSPVKGGENGRSAISLLLNGAVIDKARTISTARGAYLDSAYEFTPTEPGRYTFEIMAGSEGCEFTRLARRVVIAE